MDRGGLSSMIEVEARDGSRHETAIFKDFRFQNNILSIYQQITWRKSWSGNNSYTREKQGRERTTCGSDRSFHRDLPTTSGYSSETLSNKTVDLWGCGGNHTLRDCRNISDAEKKKLHEDRMENNGSKRRVCVFEPSGRKCIKVALLEGIVKFLYKLDSGSFTSAQRHD